MKKLYVIFLVMSIVLFGQNLDKSPKRLSTDDVMNKVTEITSEALRMESVALNSSLFYDVSDTVTVASDTLSKFMINSDSLTQLYTKWFEFEIWADDTVEVCLSWCFCPEMTYLVMPNYSNKLSFPRMIPVKNIYIRRYNITGETGTPRWYIKIQGR